MSEAYPNLGLKIGDKYYLKDGVSVDIMDVMVLTGNIVNNLEEVDKMGSSYSPNQVIGVSENRISSDYLQREITILTKGPADVKIGEDVNAGDRLMGISNRYTDLFNGDNTAQQEISVSNVPVDSVISVTETTGPTVLTEVEGTPTTGQYSIDKTKGLIIIGGTSVSGTDNYEVIYDIDSGRFGKLVKLLDETITVSSHIGTVSKEFEYTLSVIATAGTSTGVKIPIFSGSPAAGEVLVDIENQQLEFNATDAVTEAYVAYSTGYRATARALESISAGEIGSIYVEG